jgi:hypothetical protein
VVPKSPRTTFRYEIAPPSADMRRQLQERAP